MEHNFTFNSTTEMHLVRNLINSIHLNTAAYQAMRSIVNFMPELPSVNDYDVDWANLLDRLADAINKAEEEEKPKYEHRYSIINSDEEVVSEYDDLKDAWDIYVEYYDEDYRQGYEANRGDYAIRDNKLGLIVVEDVPCLEYEYEWNASIEIWLNGRDRTLDDVPSVVSDDIYESISNGDDSGYVSDDIGNVDWEDIADWESDHDNNNEEEVNDVL